MRIRVTAVTVAWALLACALLACAAGAEPLRPTPAQVDQRGLRPMLTGNLDRPLRYTPDGTDFVILNGDETFNRPLYGGSSPFRVDAGDQPEFSFYLPGRGGNLRLGFSNTNGAKWLHAADKVEARYRAGTMVYEIRDPLLGPGHLRITALAPRDGEGLLLKLETAAETVPLTIHIAFGSISGERGGRDGDIGCERLPVRDFFRFREDLCRGNELTCAVDRFVVRADAGTIVGLLPPGAKTRAADAACWADLAQLRSSSPANGKLQIVHGEVPVPPGTAVHLALQHLPAKHAGKRRPDELLQAYREVTNDAPATTPEQPFAPWSPAGLATRFDREQQSLLAIAGRVSVQTPDPFVNAALPALNLAADAVWDDRAGVYLHGGVAWRTPLLGWRVAYAGDTLGWHERTRAHFDRYAKRQNTSPVPERIPPPEPNAFLARNETALHSNGDMTNSHYDMNLVGVDTIFRHLLWTGDKQYARRIWPVIERHLAWERRLFRRGFGTDKLPLYEAYCCIWASDSLAYNGGGATHSSAYNLYHNRMAARVATWLGLDPAIYQNEAAAIAKAMKQELWFKDRGWFGEAKDLLGDQSVYPEPAAWTFYHTVDSEVPDPFEAWQMSRFVDTRLPHIPIRGPGVPAGCHTIATTSWMPWVWSLNNVVLGETAHTAHALWQAGNPAAAFPLLKGALLDSMYLGLCPGNVGMCTWHDAYRRESQRDFGDGVGALARTFLEGLFGITPDLIAGELEIRPGFPADWNHAGIRHPEFDFSFERHGETERFHLLSRFGQPLRVRLIVPALRDEVASVTVNGSPAEWKPVKDSVAVPRVEITVPPATALDLVIRWKGAVPAAVPAETTVKRGSACTINAGAVIVSIVDPQGALTGVRHQGASLTGIAAGTTGHRSLFAGVRQGALEWWQAVHLEILEAAPAKPLVFTTDWSKALDSSVKLDPVPLDALFNAKLATIFQQNYASPRSPHCSLALPAHGYGSWCHPQDNFAVDDSGLRARAAKNHNQLILPNGVPLATPGDPTADNIAFVSRWDNFPRELTVPLAGRAAKIHLLMAGSTDAMKSRRDNGELVVTYSDQSTTRLALENPTTWWPVDQDYFIDDHAFRRPGPLPVRVDLKTGKIRVLEEKTFAGTGRRIDGGAATVLDFALDPAKELKSLTIRALANEVVIGLMSATLQGP